MVSFFLLCAALAVGSVVVFGLMISAIAVKLSLKLLFLPLRLLLIPIKLLLVLLAVPLGIAAVAVVVALIPLMILGAIAVLPVIAFSRLV
jgi:hypothetical protein